MQDDTSPKHEREMSYDEHLLTLWLLAALSVIRIPAGIIVTILLPTAEGLADSLCILTTVVCVYKGRQLRAWLDLEHLHRTYTVLQTANQRNKS